MIIFEQMKPRINMSTFARLSWGWIYLAKKGVNLVKAHFIGVYSFGHTLLALVDETH